MNSINCRIGYSDSLIKDILRCAGTEKDELRKKIEEEVDKFMKDLVTLDKFDGDELDARISEMRAMLNNLCDKAGVPALQGAT